MMTRKHYVAIAKVVQAQAGEVDTDPAAGFDEGYAHGVAQAAYDLALALADVFAADNPAFDRARFLRACGVVGA